MNKVIAITGPTGSGKSSVSLALAKKMEKCVFVDVDHVKHMIITGFHKHKDSSGKSVWTYSEWGLVGETIGLISNNFLKHGYNVVIGGYLHTEGWQKLLEVGIEINHKFMLQPAKEIIKIRDSQRDEMYFMGDEAIQEHLDYLSGEYFDDFTKIDSSNQTVDETVEDILTAVQK